MENNNSFTVTPTNQQITLDPGEVYEGVITVTNASGSTSDLHYLASVTPYSIVDSSYAANLVDESERTSITKWITIKNPTGTLKPNESQQIEYTITVPKDAPIGGQYATIAVASDNEASTDDNIAIQNIFEIASIIYANVNGEIIREGSIVDNNVPAFSFSTPISVGATITNDGNTHSVAKITITATDLLSGRAILPSSDVSGVYNEFVMPGTTRYIDHEITDLPVLGAVKISQTISYNEQTSTNETVLVICPIWFIVLVVLTLASLIATITVLIKKWRRKKHNTFA